MDNNIKITMTNYEVLSNGSILIPKNQDLIFTILDLTYVLKFISNTGFSHQQVETRNDDKSKTMIITFTNFNNILGTYNTAPIVLGNINGKTLVLNYRVCRANHLPDSNQILFYYTWLLLKGETNAK